MGGHTLYLVGGAPRVGKSSLAHRLLETDGIPWLPTDVLRAVLRRVLPELDAVDQDPVDAQLLAEDLVGYRGPKPQHHGASREELRQAAAWIRRRSRELRQECAAVGVPYVDVGEVGFEAAMVRARGHLLARG